MARRKIEKAALASLIRESKELSNDQKADLLQLLNEQKRYGLVWEEHKEEAEELLKENIPVLVEEARKRIISSPRRGQEGADHILIEGDNLHALTALTYTHEGKVDVIYIDPPYNTGNKDFVYNDSYVDSEDGYRHSKWLSFMEKRLRIAKKLLSDKGVIFISIDDNEQANLKLLCDEVFGEKNQIASFCWKTDGNFDNQAKVKICHEYIFLISKDLTRFEAPPVIDPNIPANSKIYNSQIRNTVVKNGPKNPIGDISIPAGFPCDLENGIIFKGTIMWPQYSEDIIIQNGLTKNSVVATSGWASAGQLTEFIDRGFKDVIDSKGQSTRFVISKSGAIESIKDRGLPSHVISVLQNFGGPQKAAVDLCGLSDKFNYPKPVMLLKYLISMQSSKCSTILDFFAGSGTTLHATMQLNAEDGGHRKCILVTNNENNICEEVTYERNKRVINGYTTPKGINVPGLTNNNLRYYKTAFVPREKTAANRRKLMQMATDMLCIKENMYNEQPFEIDGKKMKPEFVRYFVSDTKDMIIIYDPRAIAFVAKALPHDSQKKMMVYVYSDGQYAYNDEFRGKNIELCALPDAICQALSRVLPIQKEVAL